MNNAKECIHMLCDSTLTVATAESCTGGLVAAELVAIPGSSKCYLEGCVTYSVQAKITRLGVNPDTIDEHTVVSAQVACEMARGIRRNLNADIGISTTGYAGPTGGDELNPVGTIFVGFSSKDGEYSIRLQLKGDRNEIRAKATSIALRFLRLRLCAFRQTTVNCS